VPAGIRQAPTPIRMGAKPGSTGPQVLPIANVSASPLMDQCHAFGRNRQCLCGRPPDHLEAGEFGPDHPREGQKRQLGSMAAGWRRRGTSPSGGHHAFPCATVCPLSHRFPPFGQRSLSAQLRRPRPRPATSAKRRLLPFPSAPWEGRNPPNAVCPPAPRAAPGQRLATGEDSTCSADAAPDHERPVATNAVRHGGEDHHVLMIARHRAAGTVSVGDDPFGARQAALLSPLSPRVAIASPGPRSVRTGPA
jgi:hypothetical protein